MSHSEERAQLLQDLFEVSKQVTNETALTFCNLVLIKRVSFPLHKCEVRFGGRTELATEFDKRVTQLCESFEHAFLHGIKQTRGVRNFTRFVQTCSHHFLSSHHFFVRATAKWSVAVCRRVF
jgi:hypothetical protein